MAIIPKPYTFSANTAIRPSEVNADIDTIYNAFNGNISGANLADNAITTVKIADATINSDNIAAGAITTAKILDDAVTAAKIDWASTGANAGIWWEELGRTTASGTTDTITVSGLEPRTFLKVIFLVINSGTITPLMRFNGDSGANYATRYSANGAGDVANTGGSGVEALFGGVAETELGVFDVLNIATQEKLIVTHQTIRRGTAGAGNFPSRLETFGKWANTTSSVSSVSMVNTNTGDFASGSEVIVLGHN